MEAGPEPHPLAEKLDRLLEQSDSDEASEPLAARRVWEAAQMEEAQRQAAEEEADDPRL